MFHLICKKYRERDAIIIEDASNFSLRDTLECGQAFRYELLVDEQDYKEYLTVVGDTLVFIGQSTDGTLAFFGTDEKTVKELLIPYLSLDTDYEKIREEIAAATDSEWLKCAAEASRGIRILRQEPAEALLSFIISQNNNIPRIRGIIRKISAEYGKNLALPCGVCPKTSEKIDESVCRGCGICYTFPKPRDIAERPEGLLPAKVGFRYGYLLDAAKKIVDGEIDLDEISRQASYDFTLCELKKIKGVGDKVASCVALFAFNNLEAFPIDVWMKRAIDTYFDGKLDPKALGRYAGIAQQYIFHYIRNIENS
jgi:N-glycosylase/DNA lyase